MANTPLQAIDPDGRLIIFINGLWGPLGGINDPKEKYWGWNGLWVSEVQNLWNDKNVMFLDGSVGGQNNLWNNNISEYRWLKGQEAGYNNAETIIKNLGKNETIKFVTNSMGAVFQRGFSSGFYLYVSEQLSANIQKRKNILKNITNIKKMLRNTPEIFGTDGNMRKVNRKVLEKSLKNQKKELLKLNDEYDRLKNIETEIVVDIEPHQKTEKDPNAQKHYFILSDKSEYNFFENNFIDVQPVKAATDASKKNGKSVSTGHHNTYTDPTKLPKP